MNEIVSNDADTIDLAMDFKRNLDCKFLNWMCPVEKKVVSIPKLSICFPFYPKFESLWRIPDKLMILCVAAQGAMLSC